MHQLPQQPQTILILHKEKIGELQKNYLYITKKCKQRLIVSLKFSVLRLRINTYIITSYLLLLSQIRQTKKITNMPLIGPRDMYAI